MQFFLLDATTLQSDTVSDLSSDTLSSNDTVDASGKHKDLYKTLLKDFNQVSKKSSKKLDYDALAVVNVAPSVVPNPYLPSFRIYAYNLSGEAYEPKLEGADGVLGKRSDELYYFYDTGDNDGEQSYSGEDVSSASASADSEKRASGTRHLGDYVNRTRFCPDGSDSWACKLTERWYSSPRSPSRTNRLFTPLGFAQVSIDV